MNFLSALPHRFFPLLLALSLVAAMSSCAHTRLSARIIPPEAERLAAVNNKALRYHVDCAVDEIVGHQYLLVAFPFGRVSLEDPKKHLIQAIFKELAIAGYKPRESDALRADLVVNCTDLSLSAYDFLFFRRISANVELQVTDNRSGMIVPRAVRGSSGAFKAFGFYQQLEHVWSEALNDAAHGAITAQ